MKEQQPKPENKAEIIQPEQSLVEYNLSLTPEMRLLRHQAALDTINELKKAGESLYEQPQSSTQAPFMTEAELLEARKRKK